MNKAILYLIVATSLYSIINVGVKSLGHIPATEIVVFRGVISFILCLFFLFKKKVSLLGKNKLLLFLRGLFGTVALVSFFICVQKVPLAVSMTLINLSPIFTVVIAHFYLKERAQWSQWFFLLISFAGVYLIRGGLEPVPLLWMILGVVSGLFAAMAYTCVRQLRLTEDPLVVILYFPLVTVPLIGPVMAYQWVTPQGWDWMILLGIGVATQGAQYFMTVAYQLEKASKVMIFNYAGLFWGVLLGWAIFDERLTLNQIIGIVIVFLCLCGNYFVSQRAKK